MKSATTRTSRLLALAMLTLAAALLVSGCRGTAPATTTPDTAATPPAGSDAGAGSETTGTTASGEPAAVGQPAPDFTVTDVDGNVRSLKDYKGKILVVDFWATYCKPCVKKLREYESIYQANKSNNVDFLALSSDTSDDVIKGWREETSVTIPLARMDDATREAFFGPVQFVTIPQVRIVDRKGVIRYSFGPDDEVAAVENAIKALIAEQK
ncbi:MAG: TlpA family protein disulfide reductase [Armatimonadetes bacterium]|nr:TlpA family protein disulfide reductase [Armatimonadota bacterium]